MKIRIEYSTGGTSHHSGGKGPYEGYTESTTTLTVDKVFLYRSDKEQINGTGFFGSDLDLDGLVNYGDEVHIVVVRYSTGSTFGKSSGQFEFVSAHKTIEAAEIVQKSLEDEYKLYMDANARSWPVRSGKAERPVYTGPHRSWMGYFESMESVEIWTVKTVTPEH